MSCIVWLLEQALRGAPGANYWWVAPTRAVAKIAYRRLARFLGPEHILTNESELWIRLVNGAYIWFKGAENPDGLYGEDVYAAVIDEGSRTREESYHAVRTTLTATRGPLRVIGNVKGKKNWFYLMARQAESGVPNMHYAKITAWDAVRAGVLDEDEILDAQRMLPESVFQELYLAEASDDGSNPFGAAHIAACTVPDLMPGDPLHWGWDLAKSLDWTVGVGFNPDGQTAALERFQRPWEDTFAIIGRVTAGRAYVDSTGVGDPVLERLQKGHPGIFEGYTFTGPSKQRLMEGLAVAIQQHEIRFPVGPIADELDTFTYEYTRTGVRYTAPEGLHDDCVMALALAVQCWRHPKPTVQFW